MATTWYVATTGSDSTGNGTVGLPYASLVPLASKVQPGDTILFQPGTYEPTGHFFWGTNGSSGLPITIQANGSVILDGSNMPANTTTVLIQANYITVTGFTIQNSSQGGLTFYGTVGATATDNTITSCQTGGLFIGAAAAGVSSNATATGNVITNCVLSNADNVLTSGWAAALTIALTDTATVTGNTIERNYGEGIDLNSSSNVTVHDNTTQDNFSAEIYLDNAEHCTITDNDAICTGLTQFYNQGNPAVGIMCANETKPAGESNPLLDCTITGNTISGGKIGLYYSNQQAGGGLVDFTIEDNTFTDQSLAAIYINPDPGHSGTTITENVLDNRAQMSDGSAFPAGIAFFANTWTVDVLSSLGVKTAVSRSLSASRHVADRLALTEELTRGLLFTRLLVSSLGQHDVASGFWAPTEPGQLTVELSWSGTATITLKWNTY